MATFLPLRNIPEIDITLFQRDYFDGIGLILQDDSGLPIDLSYATICASIYQTTASGTSSVVTAFNVQKEEPFTNGALNLWLSSAQTQAVWAAYEGYATADYHLFVPSAYTNEQSTLEQTNLTWDLRIELPEKVTDLLAVTSGVFTAQSAMRISTTDRLTFSGTTSSGLNYQTTTGSPLYSGATSISQQSPYRFTLPSLSGTTNAALGGSLYKLKQDTVIVGKVVVAQTVSNCFA
jgi:hypothetical protein